MMSPRSVDFTTSPRRARALRSLAMGRRGSLGWRSVCLLAVITVTTGRLLAPAKQGLLQHGLQCAASRRRSTRMRRWQNPTDPSHDHPVDHAATTTASLVVASIPRGGAMATQQDDESSAGATAMPSKLTLVLRALYLSLVFFPVYTTVLLAVVSSFFRRKIWYPMLCRCLGQAGAAFIKWGQVRVASGASGGSGDFCTHSVANARRNPLRLV